MSLTANPLFRAATISDAGIIRSLLERSGLPTGDLESARPEFVITTHDDHIIGIGALEQYGSAALLRSVAVEASWRGSGIGRLLVAELERRASAARIRELILLTLTTRDFFARLGYSTKDRAQVPTAVLQSAEFRSLCPASALCMAKAL